MIDKRFDSNYLVSGESNGELLFTHTPISFWGSFDPETGEIIDTRSDLFGENISGRVLAFPEGIGSSTASVVLLESVRNSTNPLGIINIKPDPIIVTGALLAKELYQVDIPVVTLRADDFKKLEECKIVSLDSTKGEIVASVFKD